MSVMSTLVRDPVCEMTIAAEDAVVVDHDGIRYYFCEAACADTFRAEPSRWIEAVTGPHGHLHADHRAGLSR